MGPYVLLIKIVRSALIVVAIRPTEILGIFLGNHIFVHRSATCEQDDGGSNLERQLFKNRLVSFLSGAS